MMTKATNESQPIQANSRVRKEGRGGIEEQEQEQEQEQEDDE